MLFDFTNGLTSNLITSLVTITRISNNTYTSLVTLKFRYSMQPGNNCYLILNWCYRLRTLKAQLLGVTLAPPVLPRLLARELAGAYLIYYITFFYLIFKICFVCIENIMISPNNRFTVLHLQSLIFLWITGSYLLNRLSKIPHCCIQMEIGRCLSPHVAVQPLRPARFSAW